MRKNAKKSQTEKLPSVSIVIATYNNAKVLRRVLKAMLAPDYNAPCEIIVVSDGSSDGTKEMMANEFSREKKISFINFDKNFGVCRARNAGIARASGEIVVNMDHDCVPAKDWLSEMVKPFKDPHVGIVSGYGGFGGTSTAFRKELLDRVGGYDEEYFYYREDTDLAFKIMELGYGFVSVKKRYFHDHVETKPEGPVNLARYVLKRLAYHQNDVLLYKKHHALAGKFLDVKFGFLVNPKADFGIITGGWHPKAKFELSSPRGITFIENRTPLHSAFIIFIGICFVAALKMSRLVGSVKHRKLLL